MAQIRERESGTGWQIKPNSAQRALWAFTVLSIPLAFVPPHILLSTPEPAVAPARVTAFSSANSISQIAVEALGHQDAGQNESGGNEHGRRTLGNGSGNDALSRNRAGDGADAVPRIAEVDAAGTSDGTAEPSGGEAEFAIDKECGVVGIESLLEKQEPRSLDFRLARARRPLGMTTLKEGD